MYKSCFFLLEHHNNLTVEEMMRHFTIFCHPEQNETNGRILKEVLAIEPV